MDRFFNEYIDLSVLGLCLVFTLINTRRILRHAILPLRKGVAFLVVFGPTANATFMGAGHLFENSYRSLERVIAGTFVFDFRLYSLFLLGVVLLALSVYTLRQIEAWFGGVAGGQRRAVWGTLLIVAVSAPTFVFTPIGILPTLLSAISLVGFPVVIKRPMAKLQPLAEA